MAAAPTLVIGVGNPTAGDDAVGRIVARKLAARDNRDFDVAEASGEAADLMYRFKGRARVILVDACRSGEPVGTVHRFDAARGPLPVALGAVSSHGFGAGAAIALARVLGQLPEILLVYAIEGAKFDPETPPSRPVCEAALAVVAEIFSAEAAQRGENEALMPGES